MRIKKKFFLRWRVIQKIYFVVRITMKLYPGWLFPLLPIKLYYRLQCVEFMGCPVPTLYIFQ